MNTFEGDYSSDRSIPEKGEGRNLSLIAIPSEDERYKKYWNNYTDLSYPRKHVMDTEARNKRGAFVYELEVADGEPAQHHVLWMHNGTSDGLADPFPSSRWGELREKKETIEKTNEILLRAYDAVKQVYSWEVLPKGFVIEGGQGFGMEKGNFMGIRISLGEVEDLIAGIEKNDEAIIHQNFVHIAASLAHEFTHLEREDGLTSQVSSEIASHIAQFVVEPKENTIFNDQLKYSLRRIVENRGDDNPAKPLNLYDKAQYVALAIVANELAAHNSDINTLIKDDLDPNKLQALQVLQTYIRKEDEDYLKTVVLPEVMKIDNKDLMDKFQQLENRWGVQESIISMN